MDRGFLSFLAEPWFVIPWYLVGAVGAAWVLYDNLGLTLVAAPSLPPPGR